MVASLDGFIARKDGSVDWLEIADEFPGGETLEPETIATFLASIDCYVMGARTYELALAFESRGLGWVYGDKPTFVLTNRALPRPRATVEFCSGDLVRLFGQNLRRRFESIWVVGGGALCGACLQLGIADEIRYSIAPVALGDGINFFHGLNQTIPLHLLEVKAYKSGMVALRHEVRRHGQVQGQGAETSMPDGIGNATAQQ